jgi:putative transcriptional regulator
MAKIEQHPARDLLTSYAAGNVSAGMEVMIASHLTLCPKCRAVVAEAEALCGAEFSADASAEIEAPSLDDILGMIDAPATEAADKAIIVDYDDASPFPRALQEVLPNEGRELNWLFRMPGLSEYVLEEFEGETVSLLKAKPGARMLSHTHDGEEATLILQGAMDDGGTVLRKGDLVVASDHDDHQPHIVGDETCICLVVMSGKLKFTGTFSRALNILNR